MKYSVSCKDYIKVRMTITEPKNLRNTGILMLMNQHFIFYIDLSHLGP